MVTFERLKEYLHYNPDTGEFIALQSSINRPAGRRLGTLHSTGYYVIRIDDRLYKAHRLAWLYMTGAMPQYTIDHINRLKSDNRWCNLRDVEHTHNSENGVMRKSNRSGFQGVGYAKHMKKWRARITYGYKEKHLGYFETEEAAYEAYCNAAAQYHTLNPHAKT